MKHTILYIHGQGGTPTEAEHFIPLFPGCDVCGLSYKADTPWDAVEEFPKLYDAACKSSAPVILIANSIGAFFAMHAPANRKIERAFFISPIVDMEALICGMMDRAHVTEKELSEKGIIETDFGQTLSWEYLRYIREHPLHWDVPTHILYGEKDTLTGAKTISAFAEQIGATLTVMPGGEHWFHTPQQMDFLDKWISVTEEKYEQI